MVSGEAEGTEGKNGCEHLPYAVAKKSEKSAILLWPALLLVLSFDSSSHLPFPSPPTSPILFSCHLAILFSMTFRL